MKVGDQVRVKTSVMVFHHPDHRNAAFDIQGLEGEIVSYLDQWEGRPVSANFPLIVQFAPKFRAHMRSDELETA
jgi:hypothetical protein